MRRLSLRPVAAGALALPLLLSSPTPAAAKKKVATDPPEKALVAEIPFEPDSPPNRIWVDLAPEGNHRPFRMMLDTGAASSVLTPGAARAQGIRVRRLKSSPYRRATRLGRDLQFWVDTDLNDTSSSVGWEYALFGGDQLYPYFFEIDFDARRVRFWDSDDFRLPKRWKRWKAPPGEAVIPMRVVANRPFIDIEIEGKKLQVLLDTGAPNTLAVDAEELEKRGIETGKLPRFRRMKTTRGQIDEHFYEARSVKIGPFEFEEVPVTVSPTGSYNVAGNTDSVLGYDLLQQFTLRFDYASGRLFLKRREAVPLTFYGVDYAVMQGTGLVLYPSIPTGYWVTSVLPGSPAAAMGARPGDFIQETAVTGSGSLLDRIVVAVLGRGELTVERAISEKMTDLIELHAPKEEDVASGP